MGELFTVRNFHEKYPSMHSSLRSLKHEIWKRDENGLMEENVIIEKDMGGKNKKSILIDEDAYFRWLKKQIKGAWFTFRDKAGPLVIANGPLENQ